MKDEAAWSKEREELVAFRVRKVQVTRDNGTDREQAVSFPGFHTALSPSHDVSESKNAQMNYIPSRTHQATPKNLGNWSARTPS